MVSIVVPCYNCAETIDYCLESIRNQTQKNIEIILVNDGSTDDTEYILKEKEEMDHRIKVVSQTNKGLMSAWKAGVRTASGDYIAFCDADDYVDNDMIEVLENKALETGADIVICGMKAEYPDGTSALYDNRLEEGFYSKKDIEEKIFPQYFSNGEMESSIVLASRCIKLFRKQILTINFKLLNDQISVGEDDLTSFVTILSAHSLYCISRFAPYHYIRNNASMIGKYDSDLFDKFLLLRKELLKIADIYHYNYRKQIDDYFLSAFLLCVKKEICRNESKSYEDICKRLNMIRNNDILDKIVKDCSIRQYKLKSKIFAWLFIKRKFLALYILTKFMNYVGFGKA